LIEWKITIAIKKGELPANEYPKVFTTTIVASPTYSKADVETMFSGNWECPIAGKPYVYVPTSIKQVKGRAV
jgi:hypothetical protein